MSAWINQIFRAGQVNVGNIVRRNKASVNKYASRQELILEVQNRGFHMVEVGNNVTGQYIILCNRQGTTSVIC